MSEKRFFTKINNKGRLAIIDKECHTEIIDLTLACEVLNRLDLKLKTYNEQLGEQQATISALKEENEKLAKMLNANYKTNNELVQYIQMLESDIDE